MRNKIVLPLDSSVIELDKVIKNRLLRTNIHPDDYQKSANNIISDMLDTTVGFIDPDFRLTTIYMENGWYETILDEEKQMDEEVIDLLKTITTALWFEIRKARLLDNPETSFMYLNHSSNSIVIGVHTNAKIKQYI